MVGWAIRCLPTQAFFMQRLCIWFDKDIAGQSMQAGGTTSLAENGVTLHIIQGIGRWVSAAWQIYICKHPVLLQAMLHAWTFPSSHMFIPPPGTLCCSCLDFAWSVSTSLLGTYFYRLLFACFTYSLNELGQSATDILPMDNSSYPSLLTSSPYLPQLHILPQTYRTIGVPWGY